VSFDTALAETSTNDDLHFSKLVDYMRGNPVADAFVDIPTWAGGLERARMHAKGIHFADGPLSRVAATIDSAR
jgi:hypothetical protein